MLFKIQPFELKKSMKCSARKRKRKKKSYRLIFFGYGEGDSCFKTLEGL